MPQNYNGPMQRSESDHNRIRRANSYCWATDFMAVNYYNNNNYYK